MFDVVGCVKRVLTAARLRNTRAWGKGKVAYQDTHLRRVLRELDDVGKAPADRRVLVINHMFDGEIEALRRELEKHPGIAFAAIKPEPAFSRALVWFPEAVHSAGVPYDAPELSAARARYREYCRKLVREIRSRFAFDCVLTPSDSFFWLREFIESAREVGIPTVVADKEGTISPHTFATEPERIKKLFPPISDRYFVWSERQRQFWQLAGVGDERIKVLGSMRTDQFVNLKREAPDAVLFFDFDADAYINTVDWDALDWHGDRLWTALRKQFHESIERLARRHPEIKFLVKCHPQQVVTDFSGVPLLDRPNVEVIRGAPRGIPGLLERSIAVVGFQTTGLLEASLAGIPTFYGAWGGLFDRVRPLLLPWHEPGFGFRWCQDQQALEEAVAATIEGRTNAAPADRQRLNDFFHQPDGRVAERVIRALELMP